MNDPIVEVLRKILTPLGEERCNALLALALGEFQRRQIVSYFDTGLRSDGSTLFWKLGEPSPLDEDTTVFAIFHVQHEGGKSEMVVFAYAVTKDEESGEEGYTYFQEVIPDPKNIQGPISGEALFLELCDFLGVPEAKDPDEPQEPEEAPEPEPAAAKSKGPRAPTGKRRAPATNGTNGATGEATT